MAVRTTMGALIGRVRTLIADPAGPTAQFTDQAVQDTLDRYSRRARHWLLRSSPTFQPGGTVVYLDFYAQEPPNATGRAYLASGVQPYVDAADQEIPIVTDWEASPLLQDGSWTTLTPATSDELTGHWTLTSDPRSIVYLTGTTYDVWAAAADLLRAWATAKALGVDYEDDGQRVFLSQQRTALLALAAEYDGKRRQATFSLGRSDVNPYSH